jgi:hypothetical protein
MMAPILPRTVGAMRDNEHSRPPRHQRFWPGLHLMRHLWWLPVLAIFFLSVVPPSLRPVLGPHGVEHVAAFGLAAIWFAAAERRPLWMLLTAAVVFACSIEFVQLFVHGRHATLRDLVVDVAAVGVGTLIGSALRSALATREA